MSIFDLSFFTTFYMDSHAPTEKSCIKAKNDFYNSLAVTYHKASRADIIVVMVMTSTQS